MCISKDGALQVTILALSFNIGGTPAPRIPLLSGSHPFSLGDWWETGRPPTKIFELGDWLPVLSAILGACHGATTATSAYRHKFQWTSTATRRSCLYGCILLLVSVVRGTKKTNKTPDDEIDNGTCLRETSDSNLLQSYDDLIAVL